MYMIILITRSEVKIIVTKKWYATPCHPKMHPQTEFGIPTSNNIGDMAWIRSVTNGRTEPSKPIILQILGDLWTNNYILH